MRRIVVLSLVLLFSLWGNCVSHASCDGCGGGGLSAPTNLSGTVVDSGDCDHPYIQLSWSPVTGADSYLIYDASSDYYMGQTTNTSVYVKVAAGATYQFYVRAHSNDSGNSDKSNTVRVSVPPCNSGGNTGLTPPCNLKASVVDRGGCSYQISLSWCSVSGADQYKIYQMVGDVFYPVGTVSTNSASITGVKAGETYSLAVTAISGSNESEVSSLVTVTIPDCGSGGGGSLQPPQNLTYQDHCSSSGFYYITLSWEAVSGATGYVVHIDQDGQKSTYETTSTSATFGPWPDGKRYSFYVTAKDSQGESGKSNEVTVQASCSSGGSSGSTVTTTVSTASGLSGALSSAATNGKPDVIVLNPGTYNGNFGYTSTNGDNQPLTIKGAPGASASSIVINAGGTGSGISLIDNNPAHTNSGFTIAGITIKNGKASSGGGIHIITPGSVKVSGTSINQNSANQGGGIAVVPVPGSNSPVSISGNSISGNTASTGGGGGILATPAGGRLSITGNTVTSNTGGPMGGAILVSVASGSNPPTSGVVVSGNSLGNNRATSGGGLAVSAPNSLPTPLNINLGGNTMKGNTASSGGGGMSITGAIAGVVSSNNISNNKGSAGAGGISVASTAPGAQVTIAGNTISGNSGTTGGGVQVKSGTVQLVNNIITANSATSAGGGGVSVTPSSSSALVLVNNLISGNSAQSGGGVGTTNTGSAVPSVLINNTIVGNTASSGTGNQVNLVVPTSATANTGVFVNNIMRRTSAQSGTDIKISTGSAPAGGTGNLPAPFAATTAQGLVFSHNNMLSQDAADLPVSPDSTNTYSDPGFVNEAVGDYHLTSSSPLVDAGEKTEGMGWTDFEGDPRVIGGAPDVGADEQIAERIDKLYPEPGTERHYKGDLSQDGLLVFAWYLPKNGQSVSGYNIHLKLSYPQSSQVAEGDIFVTPAEGLIVLDDYGIAGWVLPLDETTWNALSDWEVDWSATACSNRDTSSAVAGTTWGWFTIR